jgi:glycosyltransferase involved in cell wall biosynthesis
MKPKVSVLIPTYNRPRLLAEALASVLSQDFEDFEVIVRDDAGRPGEVEDVIRWTADNRILYRRSERNAGDFGANVLLYTEARGYYLAHLDDDDRWRPEFLRRMVNALDNNPDCGIAFANHQVVDERGNFLSEETRSGNIIWGREGLATGRYADGRRLAAVKRAIPVSHSAVVRAETLDLERFARGRAGRAWDMCIAALSVRRTGWLWFEREPLSFYRWGHADQMTKRPVDDNTFDGLVWTLRELATDPYFAQERPALLRQLARQETMWGLHALMREKHPGPAARHISRASRDLISANLARASVY